MECRGAGQGTQKGIYQLSNMFSGKIAGCSSQHFWKIPPEEQSSSGSPDIWHQKCWLTVANSYGCCRKWIPIRKEGPGSRWGLLPETSLGHRFPGEMPLTIKAPSDSVEKIFIGSASTPRFGHVGTCRVDSGAQPRLSALVSSVMLNFQHQSFLILA